MNRKVIIKAIQEDARNGKATLRVLSFPKKAKRKDGEDVHKLPPAFPVIKEYEDSFKREYGQIMKDVFLNKLEKMLKG